MKEFWVYTALRLLLLVAMLLMVIAVWALVADDEVNLFWAVLIAFLLSGVASYFLLDRHRDAFARRVEERASRAGARFEEMRAKEDRD